MMSIKVFHINSSTFFFFFLPLLLCPFLRLLKQQGFSEAEIHAFCGWCQRSLSIVSLQETATLAPLRVCSCQPLHSAVQNHKRCQRAATELFVNSPAPTFILYSATQKTAEGVWGGGGSSWPNKTGHSWTQKKILRNSGWLTRVWNSIYELVYVEIT